LSYESLKSRKRRIFFPTSYIQGHVRGSRCVRQGWSVAKKGGREKGKKKTKEGWSVAKKTGDVRKKKKTKEGGLSPQEGDVRKKRKEKDQGRREGGSMKARFCVSSTKKFLFLVHEYLGLEAARLV
jgi:hypothetical protein